MKILFVYSNINGFHEDTYSFGLASIVSITNASGHNSKVIIVNTEKECSNILNEIAAFAPQVVGLSSVSSQFHFVKKIAAKIKATYPDVIIVCGGIHPTINPECLLESNSLDGIFIGESENSFVEFLEKLKKKESYCNTDNFAYVKYGKLIVNRLKPLMEDLDSLPYPARETYPFVDTLETVGYAPFQFSRGCPYSCSYCSNHAIAKTYGLTRCSPRYRSPESSICEIEETIGKYPVKTILIADDIFGIDKKWRKEFCKKYKQRIKIKFQCLLRANIIDNEFIHLLSDAGCYRLSIGIESGNEYVRNNIMNRNISDEQIIKAFEVSHKYGLHTNAINLMGVPGETEKMIWDTIRLNREINPTSSGVNIFYPYKGTVLGDRCFAEGLVDEISYYTFSNERRETVLNYSEQYKKKLSYYREHWTLLVYPFDFKKRLMFYIKKTGIGRKIRRITRSVRL